MTLADLEAALERHKSKGPDALALTFIGRSSRGIGVRPLILERRENGERVYGVTVAQLERMITRARELQP